MNKQHSINIALLIFLLAFAALACGGYQTAEANKLVDEANEAIEEANDLVQKTEARNTTLFNAPIETSAELRNYKTRMKDEALGIAADFGKTATKDNEAGSKFAAAAKLNLPDKFKEYLDLKAREFTKRAESVNVRKGNAQAFVDYDDPSVMSKRFEENNAKSEKLLNEATELAAKADKIRDENKDIFKI